MLDRLLAVLVVVPFTMGLTSSTAPDEGRVELTFRDPEIVESSGLVVVDDLLVTTNDSGDTGRVFAVDPVSGETVGVTTWSEDPIDVESLAPAGEGSVWVGDIGDNPTERDSILVARVPVGRGQLDGAEATYSLVYPDGPENAETLLSDPTTGRLYVATKSIFGGTLYEAPRRLSADEPNQLRELGGVLGVATDGAFFPDGRHLILRDYGRAVVYTFPDLVSVGSFTLPSQRQGEGLAMVAPDTVLVSTEGQFSDVLRVELPGKIVGAMAEGDAASGPASAPASGAPSSGVPSSGVPDPQAGDTGGWPPFLTGGVALGAILGGWLALAWWTRRRRPRSG